MNSPRYTQHFLKNNSVVKEMINRTQVHSSDLVIDIGAGKGALTHFLSQRAGKVIAVELDRRLANTLQKTFRNNPEVKILNMNFLDMPLPKTSFKVVANIPYNITTGIFGRLLDIPLTSFTEGTIITEWGAARRFTEHTTDPRIIGWNTWFNIEVIKRIQPQAFSPAPSVLSAMIKINRHHRPLVRPRKYYRYMAFLTSLLENPQIRLKDAFKAIFTWNQIKRISNDTGIHHNDPVGQFTVTQWAYCFNTMLKLMPKHKAVYPSMPGKYKKIYKR